MPAQRISRPNSRTKPSRSRASPAAPTHRKASPRWSSAASRTSRGDEGRMTYENLLVERHADGYATIVFNRPDKLNTLSIALRRELLRAVEELEADPAIHVLILTGSGRAFTAGLDLDEWSVAPAAGAWEHDAGAALARFSGPVIGAINGLAITGGGESAPPRDLPPRPPGARFARPPPQG